MKVTKIAENVRIKPTDKKIENAKKVAEEFGVLPKEMPIEREVYFVPMSETMARIKDGIDMAIDRIKRLK